MDPDSFQINKNGGVYMKGCTYATERKMQVIMAYYEMIKVGTTISCRSLAETAKVGRTYAGRIIQEIENASILFGKTKEERVQGHWCYLLSTIVTQKLCSRRINGDCFNNEIFLF